MSGSKPYLITPEQEALLRQHYPTASTPDLLEMFPHLDMRQITRLGNVRGLTRRDRSALRTLLAERAPQGFAVSEIAGYTTVQVRAVCWKMKERGQLFLGYLNGYASRYFDTAEKAQEFVENYVKPVPRTRHENRLRAMDRGILSKRKSIVIAKPTQRAGWRPEDPMHIPKGVKVQRYPTPAPALWTNTHNRY